MFIDFSRTLAWSYRPAIIFLHKICPEIIIQFNPLNVESPPHFVEWNIVVEKKNKHFAVSIILTKKAVQ